MTVGLANVLSGMLGQQWPTLKSLSKLWSCFCFLHGPLHFGGTHSPLTLVNHGLVKDLHIFTHIWGHRMGVFQIGMSFEVDPCYTICSKAGAKCVSAKAKLLSGSKCDVKWLWDKSGINWMV